jgi:hypothetical protein
MGVALARSDASRTPSSGRSRPELVRDSGCLRLHGAPDAEPVRERSIGPGAGRSWNHADGVPAHADAVGGGAGAGTRARASSPARPGSDGPFAGATRGARRGAPAAAMAILRMGPRAIRSDAPRATRADLERSGRELAVRIRARARERTGPCGRPPSDMGSAGEAGLVRLKPLTRASKVHAGRPERLLGRRPGMQRPSWAELASLLDGRPSWAELASLLDGRPSWAELASLLDGRPSWAELASLLDGRPSWAELASLLDGRPLMGRARVASGCGVPHGRARASPCIARRRAETDGVAPVAALVRAGRTASPALLQPRSSAPSGHPRRARRLEQRLPLGGDSGPHRGGPLGR